MPQTEQHGKKCTLGCSKWFVIVVLVEVSVTRRAVSTTCVWLPNQVVMRVFKRFVREVLEVVSITKLCGYL